MSFSKITKDEIASLNLTKSETLALLSGFIRNNGYVKANVLYLTTENENIKNMLVQCIDKMYNIKIDIEQKDNLNLFKNKLNVIRIKEKVEFLLEDISYWDKEGIYLERPKNYIVGANEEIRAYLRGVFLSSGSINDPKSSYHMELSITKKNEAVFVQRLLNIFELNAKVLSRDRGYMIYIKESEKICDFLKLIRASRAVMYYENIRIYHDTKNKTNRLNNCEQANTDKVIASATKILKEIEIIEKNMGLSLLDDKTIEALTYRKKYPEASLKELSEIITLETGKKITKSGLNHRFRKIKDLANRFTKSLDQ